MTTVFNTKAVYSHVCVHVNLAGLTCTHVICQLDGSYLLSSVGDGGGRWGGGCRSMKERLDLGTLYIRSRVHNETEY